MKQNLKTNCLAKLIYLFKIIVNVTSLVNFTNNIHTVQPFKAVKNE